MRRVTKFILPYVLRSTRGALRLAGSAHRFALAGTLALAEAEEIAAFEAQYLAQEESAAANDAKCAAQQAATKAERHTDAVALWVLAELDQLGL